MDNIPYSVVAQADRTTAGNLNSPSHQGTKR
jgi:hypothetical protein